MFAGGETALALKCLLRARLLTLTVHGEDHPYIATLDVGHDTRHPKHNRSFSQYHYKQHWLFVFLQSCLGLVLTGDQRGQYLKNALKLNTSFFGPENLHTALT